MRSSYGAQQQHMTVPMNSLTRPRPDRLSATVLGHSGIAFSGARTRHSKELLPPGQPLISLHFAPLPPQPARHPFSSSHNKTRTRDVFPQYRTPAFPSSLLQPLFLGPASPQFPPPLGITLSPLKHFFPHRSFANIQTRLFPLLRPTISPRTALPEFPPQGLTLFSLKHFFSNTIATNRLPLPDGLYVARK